MPLPKIEYTWHRDGEKINWKRPLRIMALGIQGSAKSSILEVGAIRYPKIIDILGDEDGESLCWCKPEFITWYIEQYGHPPRILLLIGEGVKVASQFETMTATEFNLQIMKAYDIFIAAEILHQTAKDYHITMQKIIGVLEKIKYWDEAWCLLIREATDWAYARIKIFKDDEASKADLAKFYKRNRHRGLAIFMDSLRWTDLDKLFRDLSDYIIIKQLGDQGLPKDLRYCYRYWTPKSLRWLEKNIFGIKSVRGSIGTGRFKKPSWHKEENEDILKSTGIEVKWTGKVETEERRYGITDMEHAEIIEKVIELKSQGKAAKETVRSKSSINEQVKRHNMAIKRFSDCPICKHGKGKYRKDTVPTGRKKNRSDRSPEETSNE